MSSDEPTIQRPKINILNVEIIQPPVSITHDINESVQTNETKATTPLNGNILRKKIIV